MCSAALTGNISQLFCVLMEKHDYKLVSALGFCLLILARLKDILGVYAINT